MNVHLTYVYMSVALACCSVACDSEEPAPAVEKDAVDVAAAAAQAGRHAAIGTTLTHLALVTRALSADRTQMAAATTAGDVATLIAAAAKGLKDTGCSGIGVVHVPGKAFLDVTLPVSNCKVRGIAVGGVVDIEVGPTEAGAWQVHYQLAAGKVRDRGLTADVRVSADGDADDVTLTKLTAEGLAVEGTARWQYSAAGDRLTVSTASGTSQHSIDSAPSSFALTALDQGFAACYPAAGSLQLQSTLPQTAPKAKVGTPLAVAWTLPFDADTPRDGTLDGQYRLGESATALPLANVTMAAYGDCPDGTAP
jgi:hypothetical protein